MLKILLMEIVIVVLIVALRHHVRLLATPPVLLGLPHVLSLRDVSLGADENGHGDDVMINGEEEGEQQNPDFLQGNLPLEIFTQPQNLDQHAVGEHFQTNGNC